MQVTCTVDTLALRLLPLPLVTVQVWPVGCVATLTVHPEPYASGVVNVNGPVAENVCVCVLVGVVPSSLSDTEPVRPLIEPPMV